MDMPPILIIALIVMGVLFVFSPVLGRTASLQRTSTFSALLLFLFAGVGFYFNSRIGKTTAFFWIALVLALIGLALMTPFVKIIVRSISLPRTGVKLDAKVEGFETDF